MGSAVYMIEMFPQYGPEENITNFTIVTIVVGAVTLAAGKWERMWRQVTECDITWGSVTSRDGVWWHMK